MKRKNDNGIITKTVWITCLMTAFIWLLVNVLFTPIEAGSDNTRIRFLYYGIFQLFTWGLVPLFILTITLIVMDLILFRGSYSRSRLAYETYILVAGLLLVTTIGNAVGTAFILCPGFIAGQLLRGRKIEATLLKLKD